MKYKALMLDVDGTVVPYDYDALPSDKLAKAIKKAESKVAICFVTGRSYPFLKLVLEKIGLNHGYAVVNNGSQVVNIATDEVLYDQPIDLADAKEVISLFQKEKVQFYVKQGLHDMKYFENPFKKGQTLKNAYMIFTHDIFTTDEVDIFQKKLSHLDNLSSYRNRHKDGFGLNIQHVKATKLHGVELVLEALNIKSQEAIGVGDSYNDFSLLMACGLKVAMGNAIEDLKAIADYIAPSVDEDGVVDVINKFVLKNSL